MAHGLALNSAFCADIPVEEEKISAIDGASSKIRKRFVDYEPASTGTPPCGTMKFWQGYHHFLTKGLSRVRAEFTLSCLAYNFRRVLNLSGVGPLLAALAKAATSKLACSFSDPAATEQNQVGLLRLFSLLVLLGR